MNIRDKSDMSPVCRVCPQQIRGDKSDSSPLGLSHLSLSLRGSRWGGERGVRKFAKSPRRTLRHPALPRGKSWSARLPRTATQQARVLVALSLVVAGLAAVVGGR